MKRRWANGTVVAIGIAVLFIPTSTLDGQIPMTGTTARGGAELVDLSPTEADEVSEVFGELSFKAGPVTLDAENGVVGLDWKGVRGELGPDETEVVADLNFVAVGARTAGEGVTSIYLEISLGDETALRLELDGPQSRALITSGAAHEEVPPPTPWRVLLTKEDEPPRVLAEGDGQGATGLGTFLLTDEPRGVQGSLDDVCRREFDAQARLADWEDVVMAVRQMRRSSDILPEGSSGLVSRAGDRFWGGDRHFMVSRHDGHVPDEYLAHDEAADHTFSLGSWMSDRRVLCYVPR